MVSTCAPRRGADADPVRLPGRGRISRRAVTEPVELGERLMVFGAPGVLLRGDDVLQAGHADPHACNGEPFGAAFAVLVPLPVALAVDYVDQHVQVPGVGRPCRDL